MANRIVHGYAQMWPREVFDIKVGGELDNTVKAKLEKPGVYVLYRDDVPYYVGKTKRRKLYERIYDHAKHTGDRYYNLWNFFAAFVVQNRTHRDEVEGILIASMPTANGATPRIKPISLPRKVVRILSKRREIDADNP